MEMLAYCGLDCSQCGAYLALKNDDDQLRQETAAQWSKLFKVEIPPEKISCEGCNAEDGVQFEHCFRCEVRSCAQGKGYDTCAPCADFPCDNLSFILNAVPAAKEALERLRG